MKKHPLYKNHEDVFKARQPELYYLTKIYDNEGFYLFLSIMLTICILSITALSLISFFYKGSWGILFSGLALFSILFIFVQKISKRYTEYSKSLTLEKRKTIARDALVATQEMLKKSDISVDKISNKCIEDFYKKVNENLTNLLSDDASMINKGACYFFDDSEERSFIGDFNNLRHDIFLANVEFKNQLANQKSISVGEKRFEEVASSI